MSRETIDLGVTFFEHDFLVKMDDPRADEFPDGMSIHVVQCVDCGAHTNDGEVDSIIHHETCVAGEARKWTDFYKSK